MSLLSMNLFISQVGLLIYKLYHLPSSVFGSCPNHAALCHEHCDSCLSATNTLDTEANKPRTAFIDMIPGLEDVKLKPRDSYCESAKESRLFGLQDCPTVYPTSEEFQNPVEYVHSLSELGAKYGIVKIVPPANWNPKFALDIGKFTFDTRAQKLSQLGAETRTSHDWLDRMEKFHSMYGKGADIDKYPVVGGKVVDLYVMKCLVALGYGWVEIAGNLGLTADSITILHSIYNDLVYPFESYISHQKRRKEAASRKKRNRSYAYEESSAKSNQPITPVLQSSAEFTTPSPLSSYKSEFSPSVPKPFFSPEMLFKSYSPNSGQFFSNPVTSGVVAASEFQVSPSQSYDSAYGASESDDESSENDARCPICTHIVKEEQKYSECEDCNEYYHTKCLSIDLNSDGFTCDDCLMSNHGFFFKAGKNYTLPEFQEMADEFREKYVPSGLSPEEEERKVEELFWSYVKDLRNDVVVEYGADIRCDVKGSGFPTVALQPYNKYSKDPWNLNNFPQMKASLFHYLKGDISGVTIPWAYVGMIFSAFCWHSEDHYTYSVNYQHFGDTKTWYSIPGEYAERFEAMCKKLFPKVFEIQPELLYERATMVCPDIVQKYGIPVYAVDQRPGQFIVTFPKVYHCGFNHGMNLNEAVNFAPPDWISFGKSAVMTYKDQKRDPVFSHERLLIAAAENDLSSQTAQWIIRYLREMLRDESLRVEDSSKKLELLSKMNSRLKLKWTNVKSSVSNEDFYTCESCRCFSYLSRFIVDGQVYCHECISWVDLEEGSHKITFDQRWKVRDLQNLCKDVLERI